MVRREALDEAREIAENPASFEDGAVPQRVATETECLEQILEAFRDIADRDDIHQAADRLSRVQEWIRRAADMAAADPIFAGLRLAS